MTSGRPENAVVSNSPAKAGLIDEARLRGTAVTLAAAVRSAGVTTAMTYDVRVGTSICDKAERSKGSAKVSHRFGENAAKIRKMLDGMWVNTMVFTSPIRAASQAATGN